jgi:hypothetical protein
VRNEEGRTGLCLSAPPCCRRAVRAAGRRRSSRLERLSYRLSTGTNGAAESSPTPGPGWTSSPRTRTHCGNWAWNGRRAGGERTPLFIRLGSAANALRKKKIFRELACKNRTLNGYPRARSRLTRATGRPRRQEGIRHMDDIFGELIEEIAEETAEEIGGEIAEEVVEGLFD